ncbi:MAG: response regulator transcription factor [Geobacteraceae bacterium]|nr:response regulator transcription factor [Geobacteraceae bacterium]
MKILIVDDHPLVRKGISEVLSAVGAEIDEAATGVEAVLKVCEQKYDIVLLDISLPGQSGLEVLKLLKKERPRLPILILTMHPEKQYAIRAMKAGAAGYVTKDCEPEKLILVIERIVQQGRYLSKSVTELMADDLSSASYREQIRHERLSDREFQVACLIASGRTVGQIAEDINLSVNTVSTYRTRLLAKLEMKTNAELTAYMIRKGLVE